MMVLGDIQQFFKIIFGVFIISKYRVGGGNIMDYVYQAIVPSRPGEVRLWSWRF